MLEPRAEARAGRQAGEFARYFLRALTLVSR